MISVLPISGIGEVLPGSNIAALIRTGLEHSNISLISGDVLVVTQKIVSKAENRFVSLADVVPGERAVELGRITNKDPRLVELVLAESSDIVRAKPNVLIARHRLGLVMANAGIDRSNIGAGNDDQVLLLPENPDGTAQMLADEIARTLGVRPAVVISDSFGRPWRYGVTSVAIGCDGFPSLLDRRGAMDRDGRRLEVTQIGLADMVATAAGLVAGEGAESIPIVVVRGLELRSEARPASDLVRPLEEDLFR